MILGEPECVLCIKGRSIVPAACRTMHCLYGQGLFIISDIVVRFSYNFITVQTLVILLRSHCTLNICG